jgi:hypothetical protein
MMNLAPHPSAERGPHLHEAEQLPRPTLQFRLKAWREFERALDPLAPPKPFRQPRPH